MSSEQPSRQRLRQIAKRWSCIAKYAVVAAIGILVAAPIGVSWVASKLSEWKIPWLAWGSPIFLLLLMQPLRRLSQPWRLKHLLSFPPAWVAAMPGMLLVFLAWWRIPDLRAPLFPSEPSFWESARLAAFTPAGLGPIQWMILALGSVALIGVILFLFRDRRRLNRNRRPSCPDAEPRSGVELTDPKNFDKLCEWILSDKEIADPSRDCFGHAAVAERIADRLINAIRSPGESKPDMALVGELGSGKSSIFELATRQIERKGGDHDLVVAKVSLWPFDTPEAAVRGVLDGLVREIGKYVSSFALSGISARYLQAVEKLGPIGAIIAVFTQGATSPEMVLGALNDAALAADLHVVLWVEDLERFGGTANTDDSSGEKDVERLSPIRSLLYLLQRLDRICVIVASQTLRGRFDLEKIARFVEKPPTIGHERAWALFCAFREGCLDGTKQRAIIDPMRERRVSDVWPLAKLKVGREFFPRELQVAGLSKGLMVDIRYALGELCRQPRNLKMAMRACLDAWKYLEGEIDFDDLMLMSVIRNAEPNLFAVVERDFHKYVGEPNSFVESLLKVAPDQSTPVREAALGQILFTLFPPTDRSLHNMMRVAASAGGTPILRPQRFAGPSGELYWRRYLSMIAPALSDRDQPVIQRLRDPGQRLGMVRTGGARVGSLGSVLEDDEVVRLFVEVIEAALPEPHSEEPPGMKTMLAMLARFEGRPRADFEAAVERLVSEATSRNLTLANVLIRDVVRVDSDSNSGPYLVRQTCAVRIARKFAEDIAATTPDRLAQASAVQGFAGHPREANFPLKTCCEFLLRAEPPDLAACWPKARDRILDAVTGAPDILLPQLVWFCVNWTHTVRHVGESGEQREEMRLSFHEERVQALGAAPLTQFLDRCLPPVGSHPLMLDAWNVVKSGLNSTVRVRTE